MSSHRRSVSTADGRKIEVLTAGNPHGYPWLWIPGSPSAAAHYPRLDDLAARLDLRIVTWSRPGYGDSSPRAAPSHGPRMIDDIPDIETILDAEGIEEFIVVGWSGGGPRALACAAMLPEHCRAAATLASLAPFDADGGATRAKPSSRAPITPCAPARWVISVNQRAKPGKRGDST